jgi:hypothetical protein
LFKKRIRELEDSLEAVGVLRDYFASDNETVVEFEQFSIAIPLEALRILKDALVEKGDCIGILRFDDDKLNPIIVRRVWRSSQRNSPRQSKALLEDPKSNNNHRDPGLEHATTGPGPDKVSRPPR